MGLMTVHPFAPAGRTLLLLSILGLAFVGPAAGCTPARAPLQEAGAIAELLHLAPGMHVADVGAGEGEYTEDLAVRVGPTGKVYSTEVDEEDLEDIRERLDEAGQGHVEFILGDAEDAGLPDGCCDGILLRQVYHHFTEPEAMRASLARALRDGGVLVVIEIIPQKSWPLLEGVPHRGGHGIVMQDLMEEMTGDGWQVISRQADWQDDDQRYCVVFRRADG
jgi:tRNA A58 N-methylase Trm61